MTRPIETEADFRAACEDAGLAYRERLETLYPETTVAVILALAQRIAAEREAAVVAWMYERNGKARVSVGERSEDMLPAWTETPLYAHPPKEPTATDAAETPSSPNPDCETCGGDGEDADPYGMFDYECRKPCPSCYKEPTT